MDEQEELKKIDVIRERMRCGYDDAKRALDATSGRLTEALAFVEREKCSANQDLFGLVGELVHEFDALAHEGPVRKLRIKFSDKVIKELPLYATAGAAVVLTLAALIISQTSVEVERELPASAARPDDETGSASAHE